MLPSIFLPNFVFMNDKKEWIAMNILGNSKIEGFLSLHSTLFRLAYVRGAPKRMVHGRQCNEMLTMGSLAVPHIFAIVFNP